MLKKLKYKFDTALERDFSNLVFLLFLFSIFGIFVFSLIFGLLQFLGLTSKDVSFLEFFWQSFTFFLDVGTLSGEVYAENNYAEIILKILITLFGIIIFSTLVGIITSTLSLRIEELRSGKSHIDEEGHIIICNFTKKTVPVIQELIAANENKNVVIAVLSNLQPVEAQSRISSQIKKLPNIKIICRKGYLWQSNMIATMNIQKCDQVIILNPDVDGKNYKTELDTDIEVSKSFSAVIQSSEWQVRKCKIINEYFNPSIGRDFKEFNSSLIGDQGYKVRIISSEDIKEQIIAQCVNTPEFVQIFESLFGFEGSEIYFVEDKDKISNFSLTINKSIQELNTIFDNIIVIGCYYNENQLSQPNIILNPGREFKIKPYHGLICIAQEKKLIEKEFEKLKQNTKKNVADVDLNLIEEKDLRNILIINTSDNQNKAINIINEIIKSNFRGNINKIKILNKFKEFDQNQLPQNITKKEASDSFFDLEFQSIEVMYHNKSNWILQVTNEFKKEKKNFLKDRLNIGCYVYGYLSDKFPGKESIDKEEFFNTYTGDLGAANASLSSIKFQLALTVDESSVIFFADNLESPIKKIYLKDYKDEIEAYLKTDLPTGDDSIFQSSNHEVKKINYEIQDLNEDLISKDFDSFYKKEKIFNYSNVIVINNEIEGKNEINSVEDHDMINYYVGISNGFKNYPKVFNEKTNDYPSYFFNKRVFADYKNELLSREKEYKKNSSIVNDKNEHLYEDIRLNTERSPSYITEVNSFRSKKIIEDYKKNVFQSFFGTDIIDLNSIIAKVVASTYYSSNCLDLIRSLIYQNHFIRSYTIDDLSKDLTFCEIEKYFQKRDQILLGYIDYDYSTHINGGERKIRRIAINPNQNEKIKLNRGDRLITISHLQH